MEQSVIDMLIEKAYLAREKSCCPYSGFSVGAALLTEDGGCFTGANIEVAAYSSTVCAERVALFTALHAGARRFTAIAIVGGKRGEELPDLLCAPCGTCRQVMAEFCTPDFKILLSNGRETRMYTLGELLPESFGPANLD